MSPHAARGLLRRLIRKPGFTAITLGTLALGIGANVAIFTVVNGVLLEPLPFPDSGALVDVRHTVSGIDADEAPQSVGSYTLYRQENRVFEDIGLYNRAGWTLTGDDGEPEQLSAARITESVFPVLGVAPARGQAIRAEHVAPGGEDVAVLSHGLWQRRFGGDPDVLGSTIRLNSRSYVVTGIMPEGFAFPDEDTELWVPFDIDPEDLPMVNFSYFAVARLRPGVTPEEARADLDRILPTLPEAFPGDLTPTMIDQVGLRPWVRPLKDVAVGDVEEALWILLGTVGFVLLIACANVANLFLVRAEGHQRDWAVRTAMGARREHLARHFFGESIALGLLGGVLGLGLAWVSVKGLLALSPGTIPRVSSIGLSPEVLAFAAVVSVLAGLLFGAVPLVRLGRLDVPAALKEGGRGASGSRATQRMRTGLVVGQVALALVLLAGSGLLARTFWSLRSVDPGFDRDGVMTLRVVLPSADYPEAADAEAFQRALLDRIEALPGVRTAGLGTNRPLSDGESNNAIMVEDHPTEPGDLPPIIRSLYVTPGWFEALGIDVVAGRLPTWQDLAAGARPAVVSEAFQERFWADQASAVGRRIYPGALDAAIGDEEWYTIVAVVEDIHDDALTRDPQPMAYWPPQGGGERDNDWVLRSFAAVVGTSGRPETLAEPLREAVWALDSSLPITSMRTTREIVDDSMARTTFTMVLLGIAAGVALLLGTVGLYGVVAYVVSRRIREIGVRMALGARAADVRGMILKQGLAVAGAGVVIGLVGALALTRFLESVLYGVEPMDPVTLAGVAALLLVVAGAASWVPAFRASRVDPSEALQVD